MSCVPLRFVQRLFCLTVFVALGLVFDRVCAVSVSDRAILEALQQAVDGMDAVEGRDPKLEQGGVADGAAHGECSSLDGPFCSFINFDHFGMTEPPFYSGKKSALSFETQISASLKSVLAALKVPGVNSNVDQADIAVVQLSVDAATGEVTSAERLEGGGTDEEDSSRPGLGAISKPHTASATSISPSRLGLTSDEDSVNPDTGGEEIPEEESLSPYNYREEEMLDLSSIAGVVVKQSSVYLNREAHLAINGVTTGDWPDVSHTYNQNEAWWQLSLPELTMISSIRVWNRRDGGANIRERLFPFYILLSRDREPYLEEECPSPSECNSLAEAKKMSILEKYFASASACRVEEGKEDGREMCIWELEHPMEIRHLRIQLEKSNHLNLAEVEIMAPVPAALQVPQGGLDFGTVDSMLENGERIIEEQMRRVTMSTEDIDSMMRDIRSQLANLESQHAEMASAYNNKPNEADETLGAEGTGESDTTTVVAGNDDQPRQRSDVDL
jgi:hypothetical protein|eukprot:g7062.t1